MKRFYNCLACIMTYNLQTLCLKSMREFTEYILDVGVKIYILWFLHVYQYLSIIITIYLLGYESRIRYQFGF